MPNKIVTMIKAQKRRGRYNIYLNGKYAFPLGEDVLIRERILKGTVLSEERVRTLEAADQIDKLFQVGVRYVSRELRTVAEVRQKLSEKSKNPRMISAALKKLARLKLIDDVNYTACYIRTQMGAARGPRWIEQKLRLKGIALNLIQQQLAKLYPNDRIIAKGKKQAQKLFHRHQASFRNNLQKTKAGLMRKGFTFDQIDQILDQCDFKPNQDRQKQLLQKKATVAFRRYHRDPLPKRLYKTKAYLFRQGFSFDEIEAVLNQIQEG